MRLFIEYTTRTRYDDIRAHDSVSILCVSVWDGFAWFFDHNRDARITDSFVEQTHSALFESIMEQD